MSALDRVGPRVATKLKNMLSEEKAEELAEDVLRSLKLQSLKTADDRVAFGVELVARGGLLAVIGRSIQTQAILHGALANMDRAMNGTP